MWRAEGLGARLEVTTRDGDISVRNHSGEVVARALDGVIDVRRSTGTFEITSLDDDVSVFDIEGDLFIEANDRRYRDDRDRCRSGGRRHYGW